MKKSPDQLKRYIDSALGKEKADLVIKNVQVFHLTDGTLERTDIAVRDGIITGIGSDYEGDRILDGTGLYAVPGFIDSHVHLESSLLQPSEFEKLVLAHGVTTSVCDPHELANVLGEDAFAWFFDQAQSLTMDLRIHLSSCVPATPFDSAGATLSSDTLKRWKERYPQTGLAEMMNIPGLLAGSDEVLAKVAAFDLVDGHCPLVGGKELNACAAAGISTCHESTAPLEALEKIRRGIRVLIREGSASKDLESLIGILNESTSPFVSFCTDDRNPLDIVTEGHIDTMIRRAVASGVTPLAAYRASSWSAANGLHLSDRGLIVPGRKADIVLVSDLAKCDICQVICKGKILDEAFFKDTASQNIPEHFLHTVKRSPVKAEDFRIHSDTGKTPVIGIHPGSLLTDHLTFDLPIVHGEKSACPELDILKAAVFERHGKNGNTGLGFVKGFLLKEGAIASSVGHDSHNLCCVGTNDEDMAYAVNELIRMQGGFVAVKNGNVLASLALPVGGLLSLKGLNEVNEALKDLQRAARQMGCPLPDPYQALAFITLPVIPSLKLTDKGLFDSVNFQFVTE